MISFYLLKQAGTFSAVTSGFISEVDSQISAPIPFRYGVAITGGRKRRISVKSKHLNIDSVLTYASRQETRLGALGNVIRLFVI